MKPIIGISSSMEVDESYYMVANDNVKAIMHAGGLPVMLPHFMTEADVYAIAEKLDGLYLTGGYDIDPTLFDEEPHPKLGTIIPTRDAFEMALIKEMLKQDKPILGVCRGCQILNIAAGGDMYQDIYAQIDRQLLQHSQKAPQGHGSHFVHVADGSLLHRLTGSQKLRVNSRHHQANRNVVAPLQVSGEANDGVIEAVESTKHHFVLGLQWHPENMMPVGDQASIKIFEGFIAACK
ncbi:gamma-glutamyl-gamma-aminobutyrate hydrolase family protein [Virgibacillus soli]|uniref:Gamma-glutamyl-gamma-aminobutyrate hydrolase family protein n=1 Tax=Paracerasibacillus soli TaxID=480284 RepID=A0ABU5CS55_9BACI|nr:gamma-glutamyl-gamma-aminobutyrate hydrolase family protein [Virgibacillus soli]MDY0409070.1 gamma-glutamyl-gamma-aminobutyrate hydrolase family protein [Virgibacillus soli]